VTARTHARGAQRFPLSPLSLYALTQHRTPFKPKNTPQLAEGRVIATGSGRRSALSGEVVPVAVKEGDTVLLPEYGGQTIKLNNEE
jgi:hypothetical protein